MRFPPQKLLSVKHLALAMALLGASVAPQLQAQTSTTSTATAAKYGNYLRPYAASSLWNARPTQPVFSTYVIPTSSYFPSIASGTYSTGVFLAAATDKAMTVYGPTTTATTTAGVSDPDSGNSRPITVPRWPANVLPATGADGHADIVDPVTNIVHSFWKLKKINGKWTAALYSWSNIAGSGWANPAHYYQGARAVGIPASAGLIRKHEIKDGKPLYEHALALSLTYNALSNGVTGPGYVFPATSADGTLGTNSGSIPQGALLMLPPSFDSSTITNPDLKKIVETLKVYGAYVVDRNVGTPFAIYVENDAGFNLMPNGWDNKISANLDLIRANLRQVLSASDWIGGDGKSISAAVAAQKNLNILSMRGPWYKQSGTANATYDSGSQSLVFDPTTTKSVHVNANNTGLTKVIWAVPQPNSQVKLTVAATGGASLRLQVRDNGVTIYDSNTLTNGQSQRFKWPSGKATMTVIATSGTSGASSVKADLVTVAP